MERIDELNQISIQMVEKCLEQDLEKAMDLIRELYDNIQNDGFLKAKRRMEIILFRLMLLKYHEVSNRIGEVDHQLFCSQTKEGEVYYLEIMQKLDQSFDKERGMELYKLGNCLYEQEQYEQAFCYFKESALEGSIEGIALYGAMLWEGKGCGKDEFTGAFWLWRAAHMGFTTSMVGLGHCYCEGKGVWQSKWRGLYWYAQAAKKHDPAGIYQVGSSLVQEEVLAGATDIGEIFWRATIDIMWNPRAESFVDNNTEIVLEIVSKELQEREGDIDL